MRRVTIDHLHQAAFILIALIALSATMLCAAILNDNRQPAAFEAEVIAQLQADVLRLYQRADQHHDAIAAIEYDLRALYLRG